MKKKDIVLIGIILLAVCLIRIVSSFFWKGDGDLLRISVDNKSYGTYDLALDQEIRIGDTNICRIEQGVVTMTYGSCPDLVCVHSSPISQNGQTIICMPNRVVLEIISTDSTDQKIDTIAE